ncbi:branched-chain amino acid ABC transporter permease [Rhodoligotrophos ferricapiens]|uniref:branched-chain amino acid ABC transporter permease n=1 Tax=Rhodoligotrophos ferricapiens TaxID=3069264 RepID=UPI00315CE550
MALQTETVDKPHVASKRSWSLRKANLHRITIVDVVLWLLRIGLLLLVVVGTIATLIKGTYSAAHWFDFVMFGLTIGGVYALIALGYTMVYGVLRLINFAHGDITMTGAFSAYFLARSFDRTGFLDAYPIVAMLGIMGLSMAVCVTTALLVERICYRPFRHVASLAPLICAIGASFVIQHAFRGMFGSNVRSYPDPDWMKGTVDILGVSLPAIQPILIGTAVAAMLVLYLIVQKTKMGSAMRAVSEDRDAAALMGIDANKVIIFTFVLGACMAGIGGVLYCFVYKQIYFYMGFLPGIKAFSAAVLGGIGNIPGAMFGGFFLGVIESVGPPLFLDGLGIPAPYQMRDLIAFTLLVMVLVFRPQGLFGEALSKKRA